MALPDRRPAMTDVARVAGVSHQTVSRVLNSPATVTPGTRARVLLAVEQLGYRPNTAARTLVTGRTRALGVVSTGSTLHGPMSTLHGIEVAARAAGYAVTVASATTVDSAAVVEAVERLSEHGVDGVVVIAPVEVAGEGLAALAARLPLVAVEGSPAGDLAVVGVDQVEGARMATRHLLELGHQTVWHVAGERGWFEAADRLEGWRQALAAAGAPEPPVLEGDWTARSGFEAGRRLAREPGATAVFVANDGMALGLLRALREHGRRVPEDISVVGFDDVPDAAYLIPPLTTVRQDFDEVGRRSVRVLLDLVESGRRSAPRNDVAPTLVQRSSARRWG